MKTLIFASILAVTFAATAALAHEKDHHQTDSQDGHAATLGEPGDPNKASRTVKIEMSDAMRFTPSSVEVKRGETIRFLLTNIGKLKHEMVLGTLKELKEHALLMQKFPEMEHADPSMVTVPPGTTGELIWRFTRAGTFDFACLQPGHYEAGMVGKVAVKRVSR